MQHMVGAHCSCRCRRAFPIDACLPRNQRCDIRNPHEPFPEMLCAMDADQYELVFYRKGGSFVAVDAHANPAREEFVDGKRAGKIAQREIIVQLDD